MVKEEMQVFYSVVINSVIHNVTGRKRTNKGYVMLCIKDHPYSDKTNGYIMEHRVVMEMSLNRYLTNDEIVHHLNEIKHDNRLINMEIVDKKTHQLIHNKGNKLSKQTKELISKKAKARLIYKKNHPAYVDCDEELINLVNTNLSLREMGRILGVSHSTVSKKIKYLGLERG